MNAETFYVNHRDGLQGWHEEVTIVLHKGFLAFNNISIDLIKNMLSEWSGGAEVVIRTTGALNDIPITEELNLDRHMILQQIESEILRTFGATKDTAEILKTLNLTSDSQQIVDKMLSKLKEEEAE